MGSLETYLVFTLDNFLTPDAAPDIITEIMKVDSVKMLMEVKQLIVGLTRKQKANHVKDIDS